MKALTLLFTLPILLLFLSCVALLALTETPGFVALVALFVAYKVIRPNRPSEPTYCATCGLTATHWDGCNGGARKAIHHV